MNLAQLTKIVASEQAAFEYIEKLRWPEGPSCPHCGATDRLNKLPVQRTKPSKKHPEGKPVYGLWKCYHCRGQFTARKGTIFEDSGIELGKWILAIHLMCSSKKGISANQIKRELGISYQSAWFLCHRIREAMLQEPMASLLGGENKIVELDETFVGGKPKNNKHKNRTAKAGKKIAVMTLVDREGRAVALKVPNVKKATLQKIAQPMVDKSATIVTDSHLAYEGIDQHFAAHHTVDHSRQFVRGVIMHTNFAESYHSLLKRGIIGAFHHVSAEHLDRYLAEFSFRWNSRSVTDGERTEQAIKGTVGKRLTYKPLTQKH